MRCFRSDPSPRFARVGSIKPYHSAIRSTSVRASGIFHQRDGGRSGSQRSEPISSRSPSPKDLQVILGQGERRKKLVARRGSRADNNTRSRRGLLRAPERRPCTGSRRQGGHRLRQRPGTARSDPSSHGGCRRGIAAGSWWRPLPACGPTIRLHWAIDPPAVQAFQDRRPGIFPEDVPVTVRPATSPAAGCGHLQAARSRGDKPGKRPRDAASDRAPRRASAACRVTVSVLFMSSPASTGPAWRVSTRLRSRWSIRPASRSNVANPSQPITPEPPNADPSIRPFKRMRALLSSADSSVASRLFDVIGVVAAHHFRGRVAHFPAITDGYGLLRQKVRRVRAGRPPPARAPARTRRAARPD